jgi:hypothetical protein
VIATLTKKIANIDVALADLALTIRVEQRGSPNVSQTIRDVL